MLFFLILGPKKGQDHQSELFPLSDAGQDIVQVFLFCSFVGLSEQKNETSFSFTLVLNLNFFFLQKVLSFVFSVSFESNIY